MPDIDIPEEPATPLGLPMQPTGSGVADLEIAREQDALAADGDDVSAAEEPGDAEVAAQMGSLS